MGNIFVFGEGGGGGSERDLTIGRFVARLVYDHKILM